MDVIQCTLQHSSIVFHLIIIDQIIIDCETKSQNKQQRKLTEAPEPLAQNSLGYLQTVTLP